MSQKPFLSKIVHIGNVPLGGHHPVRIQSMTSTNTMDTLATVEQSIRMIEAGCEYVRITAPGVKEAENLRIIKKELKHRGYDIPLIADIHYQPKAAIIAARHVEKVRINPGNYVDRKRGKLNYTESEYQEEIQKIRERLKPLLTVCKEYGTAMRIGSNHGSLSERILLRYGDTPMGMVESAIEFIRICEDLDFRELVISMKASNVKVMMFANRLLVSRMAELDMNYPIHLGVTEAGDAEDGRMKSAAGIGPLLLEGIGDTVRVSLTEDPEFEIPVARELVQLSESNRYSKVLIPNGAPQEYKRRISALIGNIGGGKHPVVIVDGEEADVFKPGFEPDYLLSPGKNVLIAPKSKNTNSIEIIPKPVRTTEELTEISGDTKQVHPLVINFPAEVSPATLHNGFMDLIDKKLQHPFILCIDYGNLSLEKLLIKASVDFAQFLTKGLLDGIWLKSDIIPTLQLSEIAFGILQATGERISKTEYIACPSCGRTLFNIQSTLQIIKKKTSRLKGLKIGVMGCCVNGPGEMADAHYGYVGAGKGKITLYKGKQIMKTGIKEELAVDELIRLIKENGDWESE